MALDPTLLNALKKAQQGIVFVTQDIQKRPDYSKQPDFKTYVTRFNAYSQALLNALAQSSLPFETQQALVSQSQKDVLPAIEKLIDDNITQSRMGQLNTSRTISPTLALDQNKALSAELTDIQSLNAQLNASSAKAPGKEQTDAKPDSINSSSDTGKTDPPKPSAVEETPPSGSDILSEDEVISRFSRWASSLGGEDVETT